MADGYSPDTNVKAGEAEASQKRDMKGKVGPKAPYMPSIHFWSQQVSVVHGIPWHRSIRFSLPLVFLGVSWTASRLAFGAAQEVRD